LSDKPKQWKDFEYLDRLVLRKTLEKIQNLNYEDIIAEESYKKFEYPKRLIASTYHKYGDTLESLDTERLVYLIISDKASTELRIYSTIVLFDKLRETDDYPYRGLITKEEYILDAVIPQITGVLENIQFSLSLEENNEANKSERVDTRKDDVVKAEVQEEKPRGSNIDANGKPIVKPKF